MLLFNCLNVGTIVYDRRLLWYGLHLLAWLLMIAVISLLATPAIAHKPMRPLRSWGGLFVAPLGVKVAKIDTVGELPGEKAMQFWV